ncbi:putative HAF family extracellular repeat protein [Rhizobium aquaticum]|uniref:HAF family extracellular repeat protein n=1 Tax=Rhizobium aquaticum TaxID=1549636 RepID=A0ABV2IXS7_9HYPH
MTPFKPNHGEFRFAAPGTMDAEALRLSKVAGLFTKQARLRNAISYAGILGFGLTASMATGAFAGSVTTPGSYSDLGTLGGTNSYATGVNADGSVVVGYAGTANNAGVHAFRWTTTTNAMTDLGTLGGTDSYAYGVNADGSVVVGYANTTNNAARHAFRWTTTTNAMTDLGTLGGTNSSATGINVDGTVVVGYANTPNDAAQRAFRWTTTTNTMTDLGTLGGTSSSATGVNADGSVVVGHAGTANNAGVHAFRWTTTTNAMTDLGTLGGTDSYAYGVNADGSVVVGYANTTNNAALHAFRWTTSTNAMTDLGTLGGTNSYAYGVNADGSVVVGQALATINAGSRAFRWTQASNMVSVDDWLRAQGVTLVSDVTVEARGVSADGNVIVGTLQNGHAFIARGATTVTTPDPTVPHQTVPAQTVPTQTVSAGLMDVTNFQQSLVSAPRVSGQLQNADVAINGAHSSPLFMLLDAGQSSVWFTGDGGYTSMRSAQGGLGAGEFGFGRGIEGGWTVRLAGGGQYGRMDTPNAGNSVFSSGYVAPDVSYAVGGGVVATLSGYFNWGKADIRRGYLNGTANDSSFGSAATQTYGVRARVDWQDAFKLASTGVSPFVSYTYLNSQMNGYTETGGSFPVRFDGSREISNTVRIGADARTPLTDNLGLVTRLEYGHRFEKAGAGVSGQILGLSAFSLDGASVQQDFVRGGLGVSYKLGNGDGLVMVNSSNQTGKNTTWLSASYRVKF